MSLKPIKGTIWRSMVKDNKVTKEPMPARIYATHFAVYKLGGWWCLDHVHTGSRIARAKTLKDCVAKIEAYLAISLPWHESDQSIIAAYSLDHPETHLALQAAYEKCAD